MLDLCRIVFGIVVDLFRPRAALEAEIPVLRQQIIVLRRGRPSRVPFLVVDRMVLGWVCQLFPKAREALAIVRPDTVVRVRASADHSRAVPFEHIYRLDQSSRRGCYLRQENDRGIDGIYVDENQLEIHVLQLRRSKMEPLEIRIFVSFRAH